MAAAVLFYVLVPQVGICRCIDCRCCKAKSAVEQITVSASCCCSSKNAAADCRSDEPQQHSCPCTLKQVKEKIPTILTSAVTFNASFCEQLNVLPANVALNPVSVLFRSGSSYCSYDTPVSRLAVRLHLLFLVLLN
jgi:hypothetical protein